MKRKVFAPRSYTLDELSQLSGVPSRTIRRCIQEEIVPRGNGRTSNVRYGPIHLQRLWRIRNLLERGLKFKEVLAEMRKVISEESPLGMGVDRDARPGIDQIGDDVLIVFLRPRLLTAEQERHFLKMTRSVYQKIVSAREAQP